MLRARTERERESDITRWASCFEGSWAIRGRRQEEVSIGSASTGYLPTYTTYLPFPAVPHLAGGVRQGAGWEDKSLGIVVCRRTRPMAGVAV